MGLQKRVAAQAAVEGRGSVEHYFAQAGVTPFRAAVHVLDDELVYALGKEDVSERLHGGAVGQREGQLYLSVRRGQFENLRSVIGNRFHHPIIMKDLHARGVKNRSILCGLQHVR